MYCKEGKNNHSDQTVVRTVYWIVYWIGRATHSASGAEGQMVHLLGEGPHHVGWLHGYGVVHGWRNHSTLWVGTHTQYAVPCLDNLLHKGNALTHTQPHLHSHAPPRLTVIQWNDPNHSSWALLWRPDMCCSTSTNEIM